MFIFKKTGCFLHIVIQKYLDFLLIEHSEPLKINNVGNTLSKRKAMLSDLFV